MQSNMLYVPANSLGKNLEFPFPFYFDHQKEGQKKKGIIPQ